ncbi:hypothetical protein E4U21_000927 [Claviceps maximensis]|nr:hypothetical protein E4U21_000927 [Claviceps maximensis]
MSADNEALGDVISLESSESELEHDAESTHSTQGGEEESFKEAGKRRVLSGQKRPRESDDSEDDTSISDGSSPVSNLGDESPPRGSKRPKLGFSATGRRSHQSSDEGEVDESDNEPNPRAALEAGKAGLACASSRSDESLSRQALPHPAVVIATSAAGSKLSLPVSNQKSSTEPQMENAEGDDDAVGLFSSTMPSKPLTYRVDSMTLKLPALDLKKEGSWSTRFKDWTHVLCQHNLESISVMTPALAREAFAFYIDAHKGVRPSKKKAAKQATKKSDISRIIRKAVASLKSSEVDTGAASEPAAGSSTDHTAAADAAAAAATEEEAAEPNGHEGSIEEGEVSNDGTRRASSDMEQQEQQEQADGDNLVVRKNVPTGEEELNQQRRYFPSAADPSMMCLLCGGQDHRAMHCARSKCRFCSSLDHWDFCCPRIQTRCEKCRQLGHNAASCSEKLALTKEEGLACAYCRAEDHLEGNCTELWRSFHPDAQTIHRVAHLPRSCSVCGSKHHFSGDCKQRRGVSANPTWSLRNHDMYIDPKCDALSIEETADSAGRKPPLRASETKIRGHAARTANIVHFSETDDSEVEFLGTRAKRDPKRGAAGAGRQIRLASNIKMPQTMGSHRVDNLRPPLPGQPPLPPGPPPSARQQSRAYVPPPPPSLPAKPPASAQAYHNVPPPQHGSSSGRGRGSHRDQRAGRGAGRGARGTRGRGGRGRF